MSAVRRAFAPFPLDSGPPAPPPLAGSGAPLRLAQPAVAVASAAPWALPESQFGGGLVGGKSRNLAILRGKIPDT